MKVLVYSSSSSSSSMTANRKLLREELLAIIDVMRGQLNTKSLRPHVIAPVRIPRIPPSLVGYDDMIR